MDRLSDMALFLAVIDAGGLAAGGRRFGISPASVSERIAALEARSAARLLVRTTRSISLTEEGRILADAARNILSEVDDLDARLREGTDQISGAVRVAAPLDLGRNRIAPILDAFMCEHPAVSVELILSDGLSSLITEGIDFAVRYGAQSDSSMIVKKLAPNRRLICAAPSYLARAGVPLHPQDLRDHDCLVMLFGDRRDDRWPLRQDGREIRISVSGKRTANDGDLIRRWAIAGHGLALKSYWDVCDDLKTGRLAEVLPDYTSSNADLQLVYSSGRPLPRRCRALIDTIAEHFAKRPVTTRSP